MPVLRNQPQKRCRIFALGVPVLDMLDMPSILGQYTWHMTNKKIAILQTGQPIKEALEKYGDFDALFIKAMGLDKSQTKTIRVYDDLDFPKVDELAGVLITGSPSMVTECNLWCQKTQQWIKQFMQTDMPVLGVCYGHQLLAQVLGGTVSWNPKGREMGQVDMLVTAAAHTDALLGSVVNDATVSIKVQATHQQAVTFLPDEVTILGQTKLDSHHCFCYKNHVWGLQFHPEFSPDIIKDYIRLRYEDVESEGLEPNKMIADIEDINHGTAILQRFAQICFSGLQTHN